jgi:hypothetical protein
METTAEFVIINDTSILETDLPFSGCPVAGAD